MNRVLRQVVVQFPASVSWKVRYFNVLSSPPPVLQLSVKNKSQRWFTPHLPLHPYCCTCFAWFRQIMGNAPITNTPHLSRTPWTSKPKIYHSNENGWADTRFPIFCPDAVLIMRMAREVLKVEKKEKNQDMTGSVIGTLKFLLDRYLR